MIVNNQEQVANLDKIIEEFWDKVKQEGIKYRKEVLIPFCDKYSLAFGQGNGTFFIYDKEWLGSPYVCGLNTGFIDLHLGKKSKLMRNPKFVSELKEIIDILNHEITYNQLFGYCIDDYVSFQTDKKSK